MSPEQFDKLIAIIKAAQLHEVSIVEILTIIALVAGPLLAVLITRWMDERAQYRSRRMHVYRNLMATRHPQSSIAPEHIEALNLIEVEFADDEDVQQRWRALYDHFERPPPATDLERVNPTAYNMRLLTERQNLQARLIHAIGETLGFKNQQLDLYRASYSPQAWADIAQEQQAIRRYFIEVAANRAAFPVKIVQPPAN